MPEMRLVSRLAYAALMIGGIGFAIGCADVSSLNSLSKEITARYHTGAQVSLRGQSHLWIVLRLADATDTISKGAEGTAREVASFAKHRYPRLEGLEDIDVAFVTTEMVDSLSVTRISVPHRFLLRDLP